MPDSCYAKKTLAVKNLVLGLLLSGCGVTTDMVVINYTPQQNIGNIKSAEAVTLRVEVSDLRSNKSELGRKGDEYEILGHILTENDVAQTLAQAIETELSHRGFKVGQDAVLVLVELGEFYNWFGPKGSRASLWLHAQVKKKNGDLVFSKIVNGEGLNPNVALRSGENAKVALETALRDAVYKLLTDIRFIDSLFRASKT
jgi:uncharacterized lipoprotein